MANNQARADLAKRLRRCAMRTGHILSDTAATMREAADELESAVIPQNVVPGIFSADGHVTVTLDCGNPPESKSKASAATQPEGEVDATDCVRCGGSGEMHVVNGRPPDDYWDDVAPCIDCGATGYATPTIAATVAKDAAGESLTEADMRGIAALESNLDILGGEHANALRKVLKKLLAAPISEDTGNGFPDRDQSKPAEQQGIFHKFDVYRTDGSSAPGGKHHGCRYFVLDLNHDAHAPAAMRAYAKSCRDTHPQLADDIETEFGFYPVGAAIHAAPSGSIGDALPPLPCTTVHGFEQPLGDIYTADEMQAYAIADRVARSKPTDLSKKLRAHYEADTSRKLFLKAADEIERYYGGMMAWKQAAEEKDVAYVAARTASRNAGVAPVYWQGEVVTTERMIEVVKEWAAKGWDEGHAAAEAPDLSVRDAPVAIFDGYVDGMPRLKWIGTAMPAGTELYARPAAPVGEAMTDWLEFVRRAKLIYNEGDEGMQALDYLLALVDTAILAKSKGQTS